MHETITAGGKVLIPVAALGRAQELLILLESYWERMSLQVPIPYLIPLSLPTPAHKLFDHLPTPTPLYTDIQIKHRATKIAKKNKTCFT